MKKFLVLAVMLSVMLFGFGTSHAVLGVADDVPGTDVVIPFICPETGTQNTLWAIAEVTRAEAATAVFIFNVKSEFVTDRDEAWTARDVISGDCRSLVDSLAPADRASLLTTITLNGVTTRVYAGYIIYYNLDVYDQFIPWVYLVDMPNGFSAGFNGFAVELGIDTPVGFPEDVPSYLTEYGVPITASLLFPRYYFLNNNPGTYNLWIILKGGPVVANHRLSGFICDEEEDCESTNIPIPNNLNFIDVREQIPVRFFSAAGEGAGFGIFNTNVPFGRSILGWSYQRAATGAVISNWDVIHPMHRAYGE